MISCHGTRLWVSANVSYAKLATGKRGATQAACTCGCLTAKRASARATLAHVHMMPECAQALTWNFNKDCDL
eukprot:3629107-Amphidinium_carterae.2